MISNKRYSSTSRTTSLNYIFMGFLSIIQTQIVWGDDITYSDISSDSLKTAPDWLLSNATQADKQAVFFPGNSSSWVSSNNSVVVDYTLNNKHNPSFVMGGIDNSSDAVVQNNRVTINNGYITNSVYGGISRFSSSSGVVTGNQVTINAGTVGVEVIGGSADGWGNLIGVTNNSVTLNTDAVVNGAVTGGYAYGNSIISGSVNVDSNTVEVLGGAVLGDIYGGTVTASQQAVSDITANQNKVILTSANISNSIGSIYGGLAVHEKGLASNTTASANANEVYIDGGNLNVSAIYGGAVSATNAEAINNIVNINGQPVFNQTSIYGGRLNGSYTPVSLDLFTGNTLNINANKAFTVADVGNFQNYNFSLEPSLANSSTALMTANSISFGNNSTNDSDYIASDSLTYKVSSVNVVGVNSGKVLQNSDRFILAQDNSGNIDVSTVSLGESGTGLNTGINQIRQGISLSYNVNTEVIGNQIVTTVNSCSTSSGGSCSVVSVNPQLKALMEGRLSAAMLVTRGADNIAYNLTSMLANQEFVDGFTPFIDVRTGTSRYDSGSHINSDEHLLTTGLAYKYNNIAAVLAYEHGWGSYDSYNSFSTGKVHGSGHNQYYGMAMLGRYLFENGIYTDASFRLGRLKNKFNTSDIANVTTGEYAKYTINSGYKSAHAGAGFIYNVKQDRKLDFSIKYLWTRTPDTNKTIAGDNIHFDSLNSHRLRANLEGTQQVNKNISIALGLGYEYEFDGKQRGTTYEIFDIKKASVKGGTVVANLAMNYRPDFVKNLTIKTELLGYSGKRDGGGVSLTALYEF